MLCRLCFLFVFLCGSVFAQLSFLPTTSSVFFEQYANNNTNITWSSSCSSFVGLPSTDALFASYCTKIQVPLLWDEPLLSNYTNNTPLRNSTYFSISIFKRVPKNNATTSNDIWFIAGASGLSSVQYYFGSPLFPSYSSASYNGQFFEKSFASNFTIYIVDLRGTGDSNLFTCRRALASYYYYSPTWDKYFLNSCSSEMSSYGTIIPSKIYSTTQAAFDLYHIVRLLSKNMTSKPSILYTFSTGKLLLERIRQATAGLPFPFDGVVFDSVAPPTSFFSTWRDNDYAAIGNQLLNECQSDTFCSSKFAPKSVRTVLSEVYGNQYGNYNFYRTACLFNYPYTYGFKQTIASLLTRPEGRRIIFPMLYRLQRCSASDVAFLAEMTRLINPLVPFVMFDNGFQKYSKSSIPVFLHVLLNEYLNTSLVPNFGPEFFDLATRTVFQYPTYNAAPDTYRSRIFTISVPVLVLQSKYNPLAPLNNFGSTFYNSRYSQITRKIFSRNDHIIAINSIVENSFSCGAEVIRAFIDLQILGLSNTRSRFSCQFDGSLEDSLLGTLSFNFTFSNSTSLYGPKMARKDAWEGVLEGTTIVDVFRLFIIQLIRLSAFVASVFLLYNTVVYILLILLIAAVFYVVRQSNKQVQTAQ